MSYRGRGEVIPIEVARQIHAERERALAQLQQARHDSALLRRTLDQREEEQRRLLQTARSLEGELAAARRGAPKANYQQLEANEAEIRRERDVAVADCGKMRAELEATRARLAELEGAREVADAQVTRLHGAEPDNARVQELLADMANLRRRKEMDVAAGVRAEQVRLLGRLADVRDSVTWALAANPDPKSPWYAGLLGIRDQIDAQLRAEDAVLFGEAGDTFDPRFHEAIGAAPGDVPGTIQRVESPGIKLEDGTMVRPARVLVST